jgi:hypothetical protein
MKLKSNISKETEIQQFNEFISTLKNPLYTIDYNSLGQIFQVNTKDEKIIKFVKKLGLK